MALGRTSCGTDLGDSEIRTFVFKTGQSSPVPGSRGKFSPRWPPDGRYTAALTSDAKKLAPFDFTTQKWFDGLLAENGTVGYPM